jgi:hypothetical protein
MICAIHWEWTLEEIKECLYQSIKCSYFPEKVKNQILKDFENKWNTFEE